MTSVVQGGRRVKPIIDDSVTPLLAVFSDVRKHYPSYKYYYTDSETQRAQPVPKALYRMVITAGYFYSVCNCIVSIILCKYFVVSFSPGFDFILTYFILFCAVLGP